MQFKSLYSKALWVWMSVWFFVMPASAEQFRDYYSELGIDPFKETLNQSVSESIDPFGGTLQLSYVDILIPGNGGLDLKIHRTYTSLQERLGPRTVTGVGWSMHFGRVVVNASNADKICNQSGWSVSVTDNPSLELPDGRRELLVLDTSGNYLITRSRWQARCEVGVEGMIVSSPDGTQYLMDQYEYSSGDDVDLVSYYTSKITDRHGNSISINYKTSFGHVYIDTITTSDGRSVQYNYIDEATTKIRLSNITANGQVWQYNYTAIQGVIGEYYQLSEVVRPDGTKWQYQYNPLFTTAGEVGSYSVNKVIYPHGGVIEYTYAPEVFDPNPTAPYLETTTIASKTTSGADVSSGTWTFDYVPGTGGDFDTTTVTAPNAVYKYYHYGYNEAVSGYIWSIGLLRAKEVYNSSGTTLIHQEVYDWSPQIISYENYWHGRSTLKIDTETAAPLLDKKTVVRDGESFVTEFLGYDTYGNPGRTVESSNIANDPFRIIDYTYHIIPASWIINQVEDETISGIGTIDRTYDSSGNLLSENRYGVTTTYTYHTTGDLKTVTDARDNTTTHLNYKRGISQREELPHNIVIERLVNDTGTVAWEKNGRQHTTGYGYDDLNRLTFIDYPINADVSIAWSANSKTLTRGNYREITTFDGFGQLVKVNRVDTTSNQSVIVNYEYDAFGNRTFVSYPNTTTGTTTAYDELGRVTRVEHPDATFRTVTYGLLADSTANVSIVNERGFETTQLYRSYGNPDERWLLQTFSPENILTSVDRNMLGQITSIWQGEAGGSGYQRDYIYDSRYFLISQTDPERGETVFGRDAVGNMTSRTVNLTSVWKYTHDGLNRLRSTTYGDTSTLFTYDENNNVIGQSKYSISLSSPNIDQSFSYDANDNLTSESLELLGLSFAVNYEYNVLDYQSSITYPSGRKVSYLPDALGRSTQAAPYVNNVTYHPSGQIDQMVYANGETTSYTLNSRFWLENVTTSGVSDVVDLTYSYDEVGNVVAISDALDSAYSIALGYDGVDRLVSANGIWGTGNIIYDTKGNITRKTIGGADLTYIYSSNRLASVSGAETRTYSYDEYGNVTSNGVDSFLYEGEPNLREVPSRGISYYYDGNNRKIVRYASDGLSIFVYNGNQLLGEYDGDSAGAWIKEYAYLGEKKIAVATRTPDPAPGAPTSLTVPTSDTDGNYTVQWGAASGVVTRYELHEYANSLESPSVIAYSGPELMVNISGREEGVYYYRIRACNYDGCGQFHTVTKSITVTTPPSIPANITVPEVDRDGGYEITWEASSGTVTSYELYEATLSDFSNEVLAKSTASLMANISGKQDGITYFYRVRACNTIGCSDYVSGQNGTLVQYPTALPTITAPADITVASTIAFTTEALTAVEIGEAIASDDVGPLTVTADFTGSFPLGETVVTWSATNALGTVTDTQLVVVTDGTPPELVQPKNVLMGVASADPIAVDIGQATAVDISGPITITNDAPSLFPVGTTTVTWMATDALGNSTTAQQSVTLVVDDGAFSGTSAVIGAGTSSAQVSYSDSGYGIVTWVSSNGLKGSIYTPSGGWSAPQDISPVDISIYSHSVRIDNAGKIYVVWSNIDKVEATTYAPGSGWDRTKTLSRSRDARVSVYLDVNEVGQAVVAYGIKNSVGAPISECEVRIYDPSSGWGASLTAHNNSNTCGQAVIDNNGNVMATWLDVVTTDGIDNHVWARRYSPLSDWGGAFQLENFSTVHGYAVSDHDNGDVVVALRTSLPSANASEHIGIATVRFTPSIGWGYPVIINAHYPDSVKQDGVTYDNWQWPFPVDSLPQIGMQSNGDAMLVWSSNELTSQDYAGVRRTWMSRYIVDQGWEAPELVADGRTPQFEMDNDGNGLAVLYEPDFSGGIANYNNPVVVRYLSGQGWETSATPILDLLSDQERLESKGEGNALLSMSASGDAMLFWEHTMDDPDCIGCTKTELRSVVYGGGSASAPSPNAPPTADAGMDQSVAEDTQVTLDGSASSDADGSITMYSWIQISGPAVTMAGADTATPTFIAPEVTTDTVLTFELTVTDDGGLTAADTTDVIVQDVPSGPDTTPPVTTATLVRGSNKGAAYFDITLVANESATTSFRVTGDGTIVSGGVNTTAWQTYTAPLRVDIAKKGTANLEFYSVDIAGNVEATQMEVLK